ncbi:MAG: hypothetical protein RLZZ381_1685, partial [Cyanobacteriota bacterium]
LLGGLDLENMLLNRFVVKIAMG